VTADRHTDRAMLTGRRATTSHTKVIAANAPPNRGDVIAGSSSEQGRVYADIVPTIGYGDRGDGGDIGTSSEMMDLRSRFLFPHIHALVKAARFSSPIAIGASPRTPIYGLGIDTNEAPHRRRIKLRPKVLPNHDLGAPELGIRQKAEKNKHIIDIGRCEHGVATPTRPTKCSISTFFLVLDLFMN
jgi:hypothetical protein